MFLTSAIKAQEENVRMHTIVTAMRTDFASQLQANASAHASARMTAAGRSHSAVLRPASDGGATKLPLPPARSNGRWPSSGGAIDRLKSGQLQGRHSSADMSKSTPRLHLGPSSGHNRGTPNNRIEPPRSGNGAEPFTPTVPSTAGPPSDMTYGGADDSLMDIDPPSISMADPFAASVALSAPIWADGRMASTPQHAHSMLIRGSSDTWGFGMPPMSPPPDGASKSMSLHHVPDHSSFISQAWTNNMPPNIDVMHSWPGLPVAGASALLPQSAASRSLPGLPTAESPVPMMTSMSDCGAVSQVSGNPFAAGSTGNPFADAMSAQASPKP